MFKNLITVTLLLHSFVGLSQIQPIPNPKQPQKINKNLKANGHFDLFKNLNHPLAITGGLLVVGGAGTYIVGSEINNSKYSPKNSTQYIGLGVFAAGAVLFTLFSSERNKNLPQRKKTKKSYNASDWETSE